MLRSIVSASVVAFTVASLVAVGCGGSSSGGTAGATCKNPPSSGTQSTACYSCEQSHCASQYSAVESACSTLLSCVAACDCSNTTCLAACGSNISSACSSAVSAGEACSATPCASACSASSPVDAGGGGGDTGVIGGTVKVSCNQPSNFECDAATVPASEAASQQSSCTGKGGTVVASCPTTGVIGCCTITISGIGAETCNYTGSSAPVTQSACSAGGGTFSTTP